MAEAQAFMREVVELAQQLPLPAVPDARPDGTDIDAGQDCELAQAFQALHFAHEILDRLGVGQIAFEGRVAHQQMLGRPAS